MDHLEQRQAVVEEAKTWLRTPYHNHGRVKGAGADCVTLLACIFEAAGAVLPEPLPYYPPDWHFHRQEEWLIEELSKRCAEVAGPPMPGDIATFHFGKSYAHSAVVIEWPLLIHANRKAGLVEYVDAVLDPQLNPELNSRRFPVRFWRPKVWL